MLGGAIVGVTQLGVSPEAYFDNAFRYRGQQGSLRRAVQGLPVRAHHRERVACHQGFSATGGGGGRGPRHPPHRDRLVPADPDRGLLRDEDCLPMIRFENVTKRFGRKTVLDECQLRDRKGRDLRHRGRFRGGQEREPAAHGPPADAGRRPGVGGGRLRQRGRREAARADPGAVRRAVPGRGAAAVAERGGQRLPAAAADDPDAR